MLTAFQRTPLRVGMDDDLAQRFLRGGRRLGCGAVLTETPQLAEETSLSRQSFFLKFVCIHKEDAKERSLRGRSFFLSFVRLHKEEADDS